MNEGQKLGASRFTVLTIIVILKKKLNIGIVSVQRNVLEVKNVAIVMKKHAAIQFAYNPP